MSTPCAPEFRTGGLDRFGPGCPVRTGIAFLNVVLPSLVKRELPSRISQVTAIYTAVQGAVSAAGAAVVVPIAHATFTVGGWDWESGRGWP
jgi:cyanate permease